MSQVFVIAQGGGPTAVINATVAGAVLEVRRRHPDATVLGARHGVRGVRDGDFIDLSALAEADLLRLAATPNAALGSTRDKPDEAYCDAILSGLRHASATTFIYIGGNDTAGTQAILESAAGSSIAFIHAPKTIDNDLVENDHTPGYISAAWFVASAFLSCDLDFRAMPGIYVGIVMGRHAGFLTAAGAAWRRSEDDGPHLVYLPEWSFSTKQLLDDIANVMQTRGRCVVAMSEGVLGEDGRPLAEALLGNRAERDAHGNVQISGGDLGLAMHTEIGRAFPKARARVDTFGYLPRAFAAMIDETDRQEAFDVGIAAVAAARTGSASVTLRYEDGRTTIGTVPLANVAGKTRKVPADFLTADGTGLSQAGMTYLSRLVPPPPAMLQTLL